MKTVRSDNVVVDSKIISNHLEETLMLNIISSVWHTNRVGGANEK